MPSKLDVVHNLVIIVGILLAIYALGEITAYGLSGGVEDFPLVAVIAGLVGIITGIVVELYYKYAKEMQKYEKLDELELLHQAQKELRDRTQR